MDVVGVMLAIALGLLILVLFVWGEHCQAKSIEEERRKLREEIKGLPLDVQITLLSAQLRDEARRDWP